MCRFVVIERRVAHVIVTALLVAIVPRSATTADWHGYEKLTREQIAAVLAKASNAAPASFYAKNLSRLDLSGVDFKGADLSAAVLNGSNLTGANLSGCN